MPSMPRLRLSLHNEPLPFAQPFRISGYVFEAMPATVATLGDGVHRLHHAVPERLLGHQVIGARQATARERRLLDVPKGQPLLTMTRHAYDADGTPVEFGDHCYRADLYAFDITVHER